MSKYFFFATLFFLPFLSIGQSIPAVIKNFKKSVLGVTAYYKISDEVTVMAIKDERDENEYVALNDKMEVLWRYAVTGIDQEAGMFKGKFLVVACGYKKSTGKTYTRSYTGYQLNAETGKLELEKEIYSNEATFKEDTKCYFKEDGTSFKMTIRQSKDKMSGSVGIAGFDFGEKNLFEKTTSFTVIDVNDKLEIQTKVTPKLPDVFVGSIINNNGDLFLASLSGGSSLNISKYRSGTDQASVPVSIELDLKDKGDKDEPFKVMNHLKLAASKKDNDVVYAGVYEKDGKKEYQLTIGKFDFKNNTKQVTTEEFSKAHLKEIGKTPENLNKVFNDPVLDDPGAMNIEYMEVAGNTLLAIVHKEVTATGMDANGKMGGYPLSGSFIINGYDADVKMRFQALLPTGYAARVYYASSFFIQNNDFYITAAHKASGFSNIRSAYGNLDLTTGKWKKMEVLSANDLASSVRGECTLWYKNSFIVPYFKVGLMIRGDLSLQRYLY